MLSRASRAAAIQAGFLVDLTETARQHGLNRPCGITRDALAHMTNTPPGAEPPPLSEGLVAFLVALLRMLATAHPSIQNVRVDGIRTTVDGVQLRGPVFITRDMSEFPPALLLTLEGDDEEGDASVSFS